MKDMYMIGNTHFDPVWLWKWEEAMTSIHATFRSALDRMNEDPEFVYSFATPIVFEWIRNIDPDMLEDRLAQLKGTGIMPPAVSSGKLRCLLRHSVQRGLLRPHLCNPPASQEDPRPVLLHVPPRTQALSL